MCRDKSRLSGAVKCIYSLTDSKMFWLIFGLVLIGFFIGACFILKN